jgi:exonuclease SbcC
MSNLHTDVGKRAAEARIATDQLKEQEAALDRASAAVQQAEEEWGRASQRVQQVDQALVESRRRAAAAVLRSELRLGEPCPVCTQPIAEHPPALATPSLDALRQKFERAQKAEADARGCMDKARTTSAGATVALAAACDSLDQSTKRHLAAEAELAGASEALKECVRGHLTICEDRPIEEQVQDAYRLAVASRHQHDNALKACNDAERTARGRERDTEQLSVTVKQLSDRLGQQEKRIADISRQIAEIDEEVCQVTQAPDPGAEREAVIRRRDSLEEALRESREADHKTEIDLSAAATDLKAREGTHKTAQEDARGAGEAARTAAANAGFKDGAAVAQAELSSSEQQQIQEQVLSHQGERRTVETRISELVGELGGIEVAQETLDEAEAEVRKLAESLHSGLESRARLDEQIRALTDAIERANQLRRELETQRAEYAVYHALALDLRSDHFQAFLLEETFQELVSGASARLWDLTKRYRFDWQNETFQVVDHDNARQTRSADTLSGGETFLASLALALQLSEQVQHAAGATMLDSLFIDEGFGTLDPEALDAAASAIESLPVGGRMVGIITHIEELSSRLPARVKLEKASAGTRMTVETA